MTTLRSEAARKANATRNNHLRAWSFAMCDPCYQEHLRLHREEDGLEY
jgi:hypothetical protein